MKKINFKIALGLITTAPVMLAFSCTNSGTDKPKLTGDNAKISEEWAKFTHIIGQIESRLGKTETEFNQKNKAFSLFVSKFQSLQRNLISSLQKVTNPLLNSDKFLTDNEQNSFSNLQKQIYRDWLITQKGLKWVQNSENIIEDSLIQTKSTIAKLRTQTSANAIYAFNQYMLQLGNKRFKDQEMQAKLKSLKLFINSYIFDMDKLTEEQSDNLDNENNHKANNHSHTHSHAFINISLNAINQNIEFLTKLADLIKIKNKINAINNDLKRKFYTENLYKNLNLDISGLENILKNAKEELFEIKSLATQLHDILDSMIKVVNPL